MASGLISLHQHGISQALSSISASLSTKYWAVLNKPLSIRSHENYSYTELDLPFVKWTFGMQCNIGLRILASEGRMLDLQKYQCSRLEIASTNQKLRLLYQLSEQRMLVYVTSHISMPINLRQVLILTSIKLTPIKVV